MAGWKCKEIFLLCIIGVWFFTSCAEKKPAQGNKAKVVSLGTGGEKQEEWRTQKRTWTYIAAAQADGAGGLVKKETTDAMYEDAAVRYEWMRPYGLKDEIAEGINLFIDGTGQALVEEVYGHYRFDELYVDIPEDKTEEYQKTITVTGTLEYYGPYASLYFSASPMLYHKGTQAYIYREDGYDYTKNIVYDMLQGKQMALSDLFIDKTDYMSIINGRIWHYMQQGVYDEAGLTFTRAFSALSEKDVNFTIHHNFSDQYRPVLVLYAKKGTLFFPPDTGLFIWMEDLEHFMVCDPNDILVAVKKPEQLLKVLINRDTVVLLDKDASIQNPGYEQTAFLKIQEYENKVVQDKINQKLSALEQEISADQEILAALQRDAKGSFSGVTAYEVRGQFFIITLQAKAAAEQGGTMDTVTHHYTFNLANGELLTVRELLLPSAIESLSEEQKGQLDSTNFMLDATGEIRALLDTDDTWITYSANLFSFHTYTSF